MMGAMEMGHLSLWEVCEENLKRGVRLMGTLKDMYRKALETGISL
jgi:hypothetical protein